MLLSNQPKFLTPIEQNATETVLQFYEKGEEIPLFEPGYWQVYRGVVQLNKINYQGEEVTLGWVTANNFFGGLENNSAYRAKALADVYVRWFVPREIEQSSCLARTLLTQFSLRLIKAEHLLTITGIRRVEDRLWQLLLLLKEEIGQPTEEGIRLGVRFTHQNLANIAGTTRVTVTRILGDFQERNWINIDRDRHLVIKHNNSTFN
jgi:CRP-like cAMP-binding protein